MADVTTTTLIEKPLTVVADYVTDPGNAPEWYENITSIEWETDPPLQLGSRMRFVARFLGRTMRYTYEVAEYEPRIRLVMRTTAGPAMETTYEWEEAQYGTTRMTLRNRGGPALLSPLMARAMRRANTKDLAKLKRLLESR
ncbi:MAG: hypothetical protein QOK28_460 [Actinomycetota bacterium]|jgi:hypothetical protein